MVDGIIVRSGTEDNPSGELVDASCGACLPRGKEYHYHQHDQSGASPHMPATQPLKGTPGNRLLMFKSDRMQCATRIAVPGRQWWRDSHCGMLSSAE
jgi:hypothetical protein